MKKNKQRYVYTRYRVTWYTEEARCTKVFRDLQEAEWFAAKVRGKITYEPWNLS